MIYYKKMLSVCLLIILLASLPGSFGVEVKGGKFASNVSPGQKISHTVSLSLAAADASQDFTVQVKGFGTALDGAPIALNPDKDVSPYSARSFLKVSPNSFHLKPKGTQEVNIEAQIPADVVSGARYALIAISAGPQNATMLQNTTGQSMVKVGYTIQVPVMLVINGTELTRAGEITDMFVSEPVSGIQQNVSLILKNIGNYHYVALVKADLKDKDGNLLANASTRSFSNIIPTYSTGLKFSFSPASELKPGTYHIDATATSDDGTVLATKEVPFEVKS